MFVERDGMERESLKVDLVHPTGNQFVRHLLLVLEERGMLGAFHTTLGFPASTWTRFFPNPIRAECLRRTYPMSSDKLRTRPGRESLRLAAQKLRWSYWSRHEKGWASADQIYQDLDRAVARRIRRRHPGQKRTGIYGYEDGCLETFRAAKSRGLKCFYDLPIAYWETVRKLLEEEGRRLPEWEPTLVGTRDSPAKLKRKTEEMALADVVICPSLFVLQSLPPGVRREKRCLVAEFGSPPGNLDAPRRSSQGSDKLRVLFAGSLTQRKGLADVFAAMKLLKRHDVELIVMGSPIAPMEFYRSQYRDFTYLSTRPHGEVLKLMQSCDVLVLPSIAEGRALVQQEAMANGLPLIITPNTGGEDLIVEGETGFLVPIRRPDKIAEKISWMADHRNSLPDMRLAAMKKADEYPWQRYTDRIVSALAASLTETRTPEGARHE
jgi:glycosyltransferase involved in cell wall biosynthesis